MALNNKTSYYRHLQLKSTVLKSCFTGSPLTPFGPLFPCTPFIPWIIEKQWHRECWGSNYHNVVILVGVGSQHQYYPLWLYVLYWYVNRCWIWPGKTLILWLCPMGIWLCIPERHEYNILCKITLFSPLLGSHMLHWIQSRMTYDPWARSTLYYGKLFNHPSL